jgi:hypothetical protein
VTVRLSAANRRLVHRARTARLFITLGGPPGVVVGFRLPTH